MPPVLYSFRRCPYAMRARLAIASAGVQVELREILLRDKPQAFLDASPSGTVPSLVLSDHVIDESFDIMLWALNHADPQGWLDMPVEGHALITRVDGPFKTALDRTKYATRYPDEDPKEHRAAAASFLTELDVQIDGHIFGKPTLADFATLPFVRQFAAVDPAWFATLGLPSVRCWLSGWLVHPLFHACMVKLPEEGVYRFPPL